MKKVLFQFIQIFSIMILSIGFSGILGRVTGNTHLYKWNESDVGMALYTSIAFFITGVVFYLISLRITKLEKRVDASEKADCKV